MMPTGPESFHENYASSDVSILVLLDDAYRQYEYAGAQDHLR